MDVERGVVSGRRMQAVLGRGYGSVDIEQGESFVQGSSAGASVVILCLPWVRGSGEAEGGRRAVERPPCRGADTRAAAGDSVATGMVRASRYGRESNGRRGRGSLGAALGRPGEAWGSVTNVPIGIVLLNGRAGGQGPLLDIIADRLTFFPPPCNPAAGHPYNRARSPCCTRSVTSRRPGLPKYAASAASCP